MKLIFVIALVTANLAPLNNNSINLNFNSSSNQSANQDSNLLSLNSTIPQGSWGISIRDKENNSEIPLIHAKSVDSVPVVSRRNQEDGYYEDNKLKIYTRDLMNLEIHFDFKYGLNDSTLMKSTEKNVFFEIDSIPIFSTNNIFLEGDFLKDRSIPKRNKLSPSQEDPSFINKTDGNKKIVIVPADQKAIQSSIFLNLSELLDLEKNTSGLINLKFTLVNKDSFLFDRPRKTSLNVVIVVDNVEPKLFVAPISLFRDDVESSLGSGREIWYNNNNLTNQRPLNLEEKIKNYVEKIEKFKNIVNNDQTNLSFYLPDETDYLVVSAIDEFGIGVNSKKYRPVKSYSCIVKSKNNSGCTTADYSPLYSSFTDRNKSFFKIIEAGVYEFRIEEYSGLTKTYVINYAKDTFNISVLDNNQNQILNDSAVNSSVFLSYNSPYATEIFVNLKSEIVQANNSKFNRTLSEDGRYTILASNFAGQIAKFNGSNEIINFIIDKKDPTIELFGATAKPNDIYNSPVNLRFNDELSGVNRVVVNSLPADSNSTINLTNDNTYTIEVFDKAGNRSTRIIKIDKTIPLINPINQFNNKDVEITVSDSNFSRIEYKEEKAPSFTTTLNHYLTLRDEGKYELNVLDQADNKNSVSFIIDKTAPKVNETISSTLVQKLKLTFSDNLSGIKDLLIKKDAEEFRTLGELSEYEFDVVGKYEIYLEDNAGNKSEIYKFEINNELPVILGADNGAFYNKAVNLSFVSERSSITKVELSRDDSQFTTLTNLTSYNATVNGKYTIKVTNAQNNIQQINFAVDNEKPNITGITNKEYSNRVAPIAFSDPISGIASVQVILPNNKVQDLGNALLFTPVEEGKYELTVNDRAGNSNKVVFYIDRTPPRIIGATDNTSYKEAITLDIVENLNIGSANLTSYTSSYSGNVPNRYVYENEGNYKIEVSDLAGNKTTVNFVIDKTAPTVSNVENGKIYSENKTVTITDQLTGLGEVRLTINGVPENVTPNLGIINLTKSGMYNLTALDKAGNATPEIIFTIDNIKPQIIDINKKIVNSQTSNSSVEIEVKDNLKLVQIKVNGKELVNQNFEFTIPMKYRIEAKDEANNVEVLEFEIKDATTQVRALNWLRFDSKNFYAESDVMAYIMAEPKYEYNLIDSLVSNLTQSLGFNILDGSSSLNQATKYNFYTYKINNLKLASTSLDVLKKHMLSEIRRSAVKRNYFDNTDETVFRSSKIAYDSFPLDGYGKLLVTVKDPETNEVITNDSTALEEGSYLIELKDSYGFEQFINLDVISREKNTQSSLFIISGNETPLNGIQAKKVSFDGNAKFEALISDPQALIKFSNKENQPKNLTVDELNKLILQESGIYKFAIAFYDYTLNTLVTNEFEIALTVEVLKITSRKVQSSLRYDLSIVKPGEAYDIFNIEITKDGQELSNDDTNRVIQKDNLNYIFSRPGTYNVKVFYNSSLEVTNSFKVEFDKLEIVKIDEENKPIPFISKSNKETVIKINNVNLSSLSIVVTENGKTINTPTNLSFSGKDNALTDYSIKITDKFGNINEQIDLTIDKVIPTISYKLKGSTSVLTFDSTNKSKIDSDIELILNKANSKVFLRESSSPEEVLTNLTIVRGRGIRIIDLIVRDESGNENQYEVEFSGGSNNVARTRCSIWNRIGAWFGFARARAACSV
jgi:hypothetical protein